MSSSVNTMTLEEVAAPSSAGAFWGATLALWKREILRFTRQRSRWIGALATPLLFWVLIGGGLGDSFRDPSGLTRGGYLQFFYPGAVVLSVLFTAIFSTISVIEDRHQGFLQGVLVAPVPRGAFVAAKILGGASLGLIQAALLLCLAPLSGISFGFSQALTLMPLLFLMGAALTGLGFVFAWKIDSVQGYHGIMNTVLVPMWILSGAVFPPKTGMRVFTWLHAVNPLSYGVDIFRDVLASRATSLVSWAVLLASLGVAYLASLVVVRKS